MTTKKSSRASDRVPSHRPLGSTARPSGGHATAAERPETTEPVNEQAAAPAFTDASLRALMAEMAAARCARVIKSAVLTGQIDGTVFSFLLPDRAELMKLKEFAASVAAAERSACLDLAKALMTPEQHERLAEVCVKRGVLAYAWKCEYSLAEYMP